MIKAFFIDLDGTLLEKDAEGIKQIPVHNRQALDRLIVNDIRVVIATGRQLDYILEINRQYGYDFDAIAYNGAMIYCDRKIRTAQSCDRNRLYDVAKSMEKESSLIPFVVGEEPERYFRQLIKPKDKHFPNIHGLLWNPDIADIDIFDFLGNDDNPAPFKMNIVSADFPKIKEWRTILQEKFSDYLAVYQTDEHIIEITAKDANKGLGLRYVCDYYGYQADEIAAIGDAENDVYMLSLTSNNYAMKNGVPEVKALASKIVTTVAEAIDDVLTVDC